MSSPLRPLAAALAGLAMFGCVSLAPDALRPAAQVKPVLSVRHGMTAAQLYRLGREFQEQGRDEEALAAFRQVLMADPLHADAHNALGVIHSLHGRSAAAEEEFRLAIDLAPGAAYLRQNLAYHLARNTPSATVADATPAVTSDAPVAPVASDAANAALPVPVAAPADMPVPVAVAAPAAVAAPVAFTTPLVPASVPAAIAIPAAIPAPAVLPEPKPLIDATLVAEPAGSAPLSRERVEVSNGNGTTGLARRVSLVLPAEGFERPRLTNHKPFGVADSAIQHVAGGEAVAHEINAMLPVELPLVAVAKLERNAKVRVLLGKDFPRNPVLVASR